MVLFAGKPNFYSKTIKKNVSVFIFYFHPFSDKITSALHGIVNSFYNYQKIYNNYFSIKLKNIFHSCTWKTLVLTETCPAAHS